MIVKYVYNDKWKQNSTSVHRELPQNGLNGIHIAPVPCIFACLGPWLDHLCCKRPSGQNIQEFHGIKGMANRSTTTSMVCHSSYNVKDSVIS